MVNTIKQQGLLQVAAAWPYCNHTELQTRSLITCKYNKRQADHLINDKLLYESNPQFQYKWSDRQGTNGPTIL